MGIRQQAYWVRQAEALRRQEIANLAFAIGLALSDGDAREKVIDELELDKSAGERREARSQAVWDGLIFTGEGYG